MILYMFVSHALGKLVLLQMKVFNLFSFRVMTSLTHLILIDKSPLVLQSHPKGWLPKSLRIVHQNPVSLKKHLHPPQLLFSALKIHKNRHLQV